MMRLIRYRNISSSCSRRRRQLYRSSLETTEEAPAETGASPSIVNVRPSASLLQREDVVDRSRTLAGTRTTSDSRAKQ